MKTVVKITTIKSVTVEAKGDHVEIVLSNGFMSITELLTPDAAGVLGEALAYEGARAFRAEQGGAGVAP